MKIKNILIIIGVATIFAETAIAQVTADFVADKTSGCSPISVSFTNKSTGTGTLTYTWDFGNGNQSTQTDAQAIYSTAGKYTVKLTVSNGSQTASKSMVIKAFKNPTANFTANSKGCAPLNVQFVDQSVNGDTTLKSWFWDFRTGTTKSEPNPTLKYDVAGKYSVLLTVTDNNGCESSFEKKQYIDVANKPQVVFSADPPSACKVPAQIKFKNNSTGSGNLSYEWNFQNGNTSSLKEPIFTYNSFGSYTVGLKVTSDYGCSDNLSVPSAVTIGAVKASGTLKQNGVTIVNNGSICAGVVDFQNSSTGTPTVMWDFGDGSLPDYSVSGSHSYLDAGNYTVKLIASPGSTCADTVKWAVKVEKALAEFTMSPDKACQVPVLVQFTNTSQSAATYTWTFPDGTTSTSQNTSYNFTIPRDRDEYVVHDPFTFDVKLVAKTASGCPSERIKTFTVTRPTAKFRVDSTEGCVPLKVSFFDYSSSELGVTSYKWIFGDGKDTTTLVGSANHTYTSAGRFKSRLIITNVSGCKDTSYVIVVKAGNAPHPNFTTSVPTACSSTSVQLFNSTPLADSVDYWHYSTGATSISTCSTEPNPIWKFRNDVGNLPIKLRVGSKGCYSEKTIAGAINITGPIGEFTFSINCNEPLKYTFTGTAKGQTSFEWDFGDGVKDNVNLNPVHTYAAAGNYTVKFTTTNGSCNDVVSKDVYVRVPNALFQSKNKACVNEVLNFKSGQSHSIPPVLCIDKFMWDFGDQSPKVYSSSDSIKHSFNARGSYTVSLTAFYDNGCSNTATKVIPVFQPYAGMKSDTAFGCTPLLVEFTDTSKKYVNELLKWELDYGDNTPPVQINSGQSVSYVYGSTGNYFAVLTVTDTMKCKSSDTISIGIGDPTAQFINITPTEICAGEKVSFGLWEPEPDSILWNFGDGTTSKSLTNPIEHVFNNEGNFDVSLTVYRYGCSKSMTIGDGFVRVQKASAEFDVSDSVWNCYPKPIQLSPKFISKNTKSGTWDFGYDNNTAALDTSKHPQIYTYTYSVPGTYHPKLTVTTTANCTHTYSREVKISGPTGSFNISPAKACIGDEITISLKDSSNLVKFEWDLGDGRVVQGNPVKFKYSSGGDKLIGMILYGRLENCKPVDTVRYKMDNLKAQFTINNTVFCENSNLFFSNASVGQNSQSWAFGDGAVSTDVSPSHVFSLGNYNVRLVVRNAVGCSDTAKQFISVNPLPKLKVSNDTSICFGGQAMLRASGGDQIVWRPGGGLADSTSYNLIVTPSEDITYKATVTIFSTKCARTDSVRVSVYQPPVITVEPASETTIHIGEPLQLVATTQVPVTYMWLPDYRLSCTNCANPIAKPLVDTTYTVEVKDLNNCFSKNAKVKILVNKDVPLGMPEAFTPEGEEQNRILMPRGFGIEELLEFKIYNRWGNLVFSSTDISKGWDGKFQGKAQPVDTYIYVVTARMATPDGTGFIKTIKGTVLLIR